MNNKDADQTAGMRRLVCGLVVRKPLKTGFLTSRPILYSIKATKEQKQMRRADDKSRNWRAKGKFCTEFE